MTDFDKKISLLFPVSIFQSNVR